MGNFVLKYVHSINCFLIFDLISNILIHSLEDIFLDNLQIGPVSKHAMY